MDIEDERLLALLDRYLKVIEAGEHPPFPYINAVFSEVSAILMARHQHGGACSGRVLAQKTIALIEAASVHEFFSIWKAALAS